MVNKCGFSDVSKEMLVWSGYIEKINKNQVAKEIYKGRMNGPWEVQGSHGWMKSENPKNNRVKEFKELKAFLGGLSVYGHGRTNICRIYVMNTNIVCVH